MKSDQTESANGRATISSDGFSPRPAPENSQLRAGVIAPHPQDLRSGGGMGLNLVQILSERWGVVRAAEGAIRVWAQLPRAAALAPAVDARGEEADPCRA